MSKTYDNPEYDPPRSSVQNVWKYNKVVEYVKCYDKFNQELHVGDYVDVQKNGVHQIYTKENGQLYFKPYGKEDLVYVYFSNDLAKCDIYGNWLI